MKWMNRNLEINNEFINIKSATFWKRAQNKNVLHNKKCDWNAYVIIFDMNIMDP